MLVLKEALKEHFSLINKLTAFIFNFAHLSVVGIFSEVHWTGDIVIGPEIYYCYPPSENWSVPVCQTKVDKRIEILH